MVNFYLTDRACLREVAVPPITHRLELQFAQSIDEGGGTMFTARCSNRGQMSVGKNIVKPGLKQCVVIVENRQIPDR